MKWMLLLLAPIRIFACHTVDGDRILARDLAAAIPAFSRMDPALPVAASPIPGAVRVLHTSEILRLASANGIALAAPVDEVCFVRLSEPLTAEKLLPILQKAVGVDDASIWILDFIRTEVPRGPLEFSRAGLNASGLWRGQVVYAPSRSIPIWVKVQVTIEGTWVEAARPIAAGKLIDASQLVIHSGPRFPFGAMPLDSIDRVAGKAALRSIRAGEPIFSSALTNPREVERGDTVTVEVTSGSAKLAFDATAESSGHTGEAIVLRNPETGRYFQARIEGKDKVGIRK